MHIDVLAGEQKVLDFGARGEVVFEWLVDILYETVHSTCFTADIITVGEGGGSVCCADMFPQVWEFLFELIEHDFRSEERRVGEECVHTCSSRWWSTH